MALVARPEEAAACPPLQPGEATQPSPLVLLAARLGPAAAAGPVRSVVGRQTRTGAASRCWHRGRPQPAPTSCILRRRRIGRAWGTPASTPSWRYRGCGSRGSRCCGWACAAGSAPSIPWSPLCSPAGRLHHHGPGAEATRPAADQSLLLHHVPGQLGGKGTSSPQAGTALG